MKKKHLLLLLLTCFITKQASAKCIALVTSGVSHFWSEVIAGAEQAANEVGITVYARGTVNDDDEEGQQFIINHAIYTEKCQGLLLAPNSIERLKEIALLKQEGIPTVYIDRDIGGARVSVVKTNNIYAGRLAGQAMINALNGKGNVAILGFKKGILNTDVRQNVFIDVAKKGGLNINAIEHLSTRIGDSRIKAFNILNKLENIDAIFTDNEITTVATILALRKMGKLGKIIHIGFDGHKLISDSLIKGNLQGVVLQDAFQMGYQGVLTLHKTMQGEKVSEYITTSSMYIDNNNMNDNQTIKALKAYQ